MMKPTEKLIQPNSVTLIKIPDSVYDLLDPAKITDRENSAYLGEVTILDKDYISLDFYQSEYYVLKNGPNPNSIPLSFRAKLADAEEKSMFMFTESDSDFNVQANISLSGSLVPTTLQTFGKYDAADSLNGYGS